MAECASFVLDVQWALRSSATSKQPIASGASTLAVALDVLFEHLKALNVNESKVDEVRLLTLAHSHEHACRSPCQGTLPQADLSRKWAESSAKPESFPNARSVGTQCNVSETRTQILADVTRTQILADESHTQTPADETRTQALADVTATVDSGRKTVDTSTVDSGRRVTDSPTVGSGQKEIHSPTADSGQKEIDSPMADSGLKVIDSPTVGSGQKEIHSPTADCGRKVISSPVADCGRKVISSPVADGRKVFRSPMGGRKVILSPLVDCHKAADYSDSERKGITPSTGCSQKSILGLTDGRQADKAIDGEVSDEGPVTDGGRPPQKPCLWLGAPLGDDMARCAPHIPFSPGAYGVRLTPSRRQLRVSPNAARNISPVAQPAPDDRAVEQSRSPWTLDSASESSRIGSERKNCPCELNAFTPYGWSASFTQNLDNSDLSYSFLSPNQSRRPECVPPFDPHTFPDPHGAIPPEKVDEQTASKVTSRVEAPDVATIATPSRAHRLGDVTPSTPPLPIGRSKHSPEAPSAATSPARTESILTPSLPPARAIEMLRSKFRIPESPLRRRRRSNDLEVGAKIRELRFAYGIF